MRSPYLSPHSRRMRLRTLYSPTLAAASRSDQPVAEREAHVQVQTVPRVAREVGKRLIRLAGKRRFAQRAQRPAHPLKTSLRHRRPAAPSVYCRTKRSSGWAEGLMKAARQAARRAALGGPSACGIALKKRRGQAFCRSSGSEAAPERGCPRAQYARLGAARRGGKRLGKARIYSKNPLLLQKRVL